MTLPRSVSVWAGRFLSSLRRVWKGCVASFQTFAGRQGMVPAEGGYTLTEIMIALAIVSMVLGGATYYAFGQLEKAKKKETINMMHKVKDAVLQWRIDQTGEQCPSSLADLVTSKILTKEPKDGWGRPFVMRCPGEHDTDGIDLLSFGKDGKEGTTDDLKSWDENK
ncbi:MAG TPA: type II secretion system protein GspG [Pseudomonadota bacterium]|nr:type II secretion system protein GspG [Pseudomonadota bacterium]